MDQKDESVADLIWFYMYFMDNISGLVMILCQHAFID